MKYLFLSVACFGLGVVCVGFYKQVFLGDIHGLTISLCGCFVAMTGAIGVIVKDRLL